MVKFDTGLAPNPFGKYCTLAVCTPNHRGAKLVDGDWILGHGTKSEGNKLIYAMEVTEVLNFNDYFHDSRFQYKKPVINGTRREKVGDNMYYKEKNVWRQTNTILHKGATKQDTKYPLVFISDNFYYYGINSIKHFAHEFPHLVWKRNGFKYTYDEAKIKDFIKWLLKHKKSHKTTKTTNEIEDCEDDCERKTKC